MRKTQETLARASNEKSLSVCTHVAAADRRPAMLARFHRLRNRMLAFARVQQENVTPPGTHLHETA